MRVAGSVKRVSAAASEGAQAIAALHAFLAGDPPQYRPPRGTAVEGPLLNA
jgi:hypothetical protein